MPGLSRTSSVWLPVAVILIAMLSIQSGASLAKSLFPLVGAPGVTALRIVLGTAILVVIFKPWRLRFKKEQRLPLLFYGLSLGAMNYLLYSDDTAGDRRRAGVYRPAGGGAFLLATSGRFYLGRVSRSGLMVPAAAGPERR